jgi:hypothetical protein
MLLMFRSRFRSTFSKSAAVLSDLQFPSFADKGYALRSYEFRLPTERGLGKWVMQLSRFTQEECEPDNRAHSFEVGSEGNEQRLRYSGSRGLITERRTI